MNRDRFETIDRNDDDDDTGTGSIKTHGSDTRRVLTPYDPLKSSKKLLPGIEPGLLDSKSKVLTITPQERVRVIWISDMDFGPTGRVRVVYEYLRV